MLKERRTKRKFTELLKRPGQKERRRTTWWMKRGGREEKQQVLRLYTSVHGGSAVGNDGQNTG
jgi:hypothetical protein